jgi:hypothetical protein
MPYTGNKPSAVPLTSADIADSIITSAKIVDGTIVNADINTSAAIASTKLSGITSPAAFRNLIINGDMQVAQRSTSLSSITTGGYKTLDRYYLGLTTLGTWTQSQSTDVPSGYGFANSLKMDNTTADASPAAGDLCFITQIIEGQNLQYLKKGTANASSLTVSFWVKSTKTGTFIVELYDYINNRSISKSYTVAASNTWEFETVTFAGDTTGTITNSNVAGIELNFWLGAGSNYTSGSLQTSWGSYTAANRAVGQVNCADSTSNDFLITGVQLEAGTSATDFEFLPIDIDLTRCQRYYQVFGSDTSGDFPLGRLTNTNQNGIFSTILPVRMRTAPTGTVTVSDTSGSYVSRALSESTVQSVATDATDASYADVGTLTITAEL